MCGQPHLLPHAGNSEVKLVHVEKTARREDRQLPPDVPHALMVGCTLLKRSTRTLSPTLSQQTDVEENL